MERKIRRAAIKTFETADGGHLWGGIGQEPTEEVGILLAVARKRKKGTFKLGEDYVGEPGVLDVNLEMIGCNICRSRVEELKK